ncbi:excinuclease ABC subunit A [Microgenomates group bacterium RBG_16_45_19]|nr:MAG: excinuclease ABC subunit A [Microgenomates group bacterium RBG_16_45_19]
MSPTSVSPLTHLLIRGAKQHNLKNVSLNLPKNQLVVFTGLSGSGKSSLAFDTIYAEGQRRYVESLSSYARQFLGIMPKPEVESIDGLAPAISIDQKTTSHNPRSTVGTITEIYDYLRLLYARIGQAHCPRCLKALTPQTTDQITTAITQLIVASATTAVPSRWLILSPVIRDQPGDFNHLFTSLHRQGYQHLRLDGRLHSLDQDLLLLKTNRHTIEVVLDRLTYSPKVKPASATLTARLSQVVESALSLSQGYIIAAQVHDPALTFPADPHQYTDHLYSQLLTCPDCRLDFPELEPALFSFNTPQGACPTCHGLGTLLKIDPQKLIAPELTLTEGALIPLARALTSDSWYARKLQVVTTASDQVSTSPFLELPQPLRQEILYGSRRWYRVSGSSRSGRNLSYTFQWEGVVNELERRYRETKSDFIRAEIGRFMTKHTCPTCQGARLKPESLLVTINHLNLHQLTSLSLAEALTFFKTLDHQLTSPTATQFTPAQKAVSLNVAQAILKRCQFLLAVGLDYLTLNREAASLAGGEAQRIRLASQIGSGLTGVLYVMDEPTIGLHPRDNHRLIQTLLKLRDLGNTLIVVEHDREIMKAADYLVDFGPKAGDHGGQIVAQGTLNDLKEQPLSLTGQYLSQRRQISPSRLKTAAAHLKHRLTLPLIVAPSPAATLTLTGATQNNLKQLTVAFPLGQLIAVSGVSGSGKSSLIHDTLYPALKQALTATPIETPNFTHLEGFESITKVALIDQSPIGRTPRSNPVTYTKAFDHIRQLFTQTRTARTKGFKAGRFSFNVKGGRCEACQGGGVIKITMQFLPDIYVTCDSCHGLRYNRDTLAVLYRGLSIAEVLNLSVDQALNHFSAHPKLVHILATLQAVGLGYLKLGQTAPTLSGGEAQRVKLSRELSQTSAGHTVYLLDEPTTGLHFEDVFNLMVILKELVSANNTVIIIEHNLDVLANADWLIDLGPEGGAGGGRLIAAGPPAVISKDPQSYTGRFLHHRPIQDP